MTQLKPRLSRQPVRGFGGLPMQVTRSSALSPETIRRRAIFEAIKDLGEVVYAIRCKDGAIKIGWTSNLNNRRHAFTSNLQAILAVVPGTYDDEQALHRQFRPHLKRGHEYYHAAPEILAWVNEVRQRCGIEMVAG